MQLNFTFMTVDSGEFYIKTTEIYNLTLHSASYSLYLKTSCFFVSKFVLSFAQKADDKNDMDQSCFYTSCHFYPRTCILLLSLSLHTYRNLSGI